MYDLGKLFGSITSRSLNKKSGIAVHFSQPLCFCLKMSAGFLLYLFFYRHTLHCQDFNWLFNQVQKDCYMESQIYKQFKYKNFIYYVFFDLMNGTR